MTVVQNVVRRPDGSTVRGARVEIRLIAGLNTPGFLAASTIGVPLVVITDSTGSWTADITPNSEILPANTHYEVREEGGGLVSKFAIIVPALDGPYNVSELIALAPPAPDPWTPIMGPQGPEGPPGGAYASAYWNYQTQTTAPPAVGALRTSAGEGTAWLSKTDDDGFDRSAGIFDLELGDTLWVNPATGTGKVVVEVTSLPVDNGAYATFSYDLISGTTNAAKGTRVEISLVRRVVQLSNDIPSYTTPSIPGSAGTSLFASRSDHVHHTRSVPLAPMLYRFQATGLPPTLQGRVSGNSTTPGASTLAYFTYQTDDANGSTAPRLRAIEAGTILYYQDRADETKWSRWLVNGAVQDFPAQRYCAIPVQFLNASAVGITDMQLAIFLFP